MDDFRDDRELSDLFRHKLENAEIIPSPSLGANLMRKVGIREFLRFNPARFNIWYAGAVAAAGTALAVILTLSPEQNNESQPPLPVETEQESADKSVAKDISVLVDASGNERKIGTGIDKTVTPEVNESKSSRKEPLPSSQSGNNPSGEAQKVIKLPATTVLNDSPADRNIINNSRNRSLIEASATAGCSPLKVFFKSLAGAADSCVWHFGDGGYSSMRNPAWIFEGAGEYKVTLQVTSSGMKTVHSVIITVHPKPVAKFEIAPEKAILPRDEVSFRNYSEGAVTYRWNFGDELTSDLFEPRHTYRKYGNYNVELIATSENGCSDTVVIYNAFSSSGNYIEFPNAFIPNPTGPSGGNYSQKSDESSQIFHPVFSGVTDYQLRIYSKRGILIFESNDINYGWDGYYKGQMCDPGVYVWKVRGNFINNGQFTKAGDVTLLRN